MSTSISNYFKQEQPEQPEQQDQNQNPNPNQEQEKEQEDSNPLPPTLTKYLLQPHHPQSNTTTTTQNTNIIPPKLLHRIKSHPTLTPLRRRTYLALLTVPRGHWTTYTALATHLGTSSPRAVGTAMRTNPFAPDVPCHRVLAAGGYLGGYMGSRPPSSSVASLKRKREGVGKEGDKEGDGKGKGKGTSGAGVEKGNGGGEHKLEWKRRLLEAEGVEFGVDSAGRVRAKGVCFGGFT
ncbi:MGMT family protein [Aspergillus candidus]|uniref:Methylated-DNA--protein-cysteine methyltransferase n=1 Tax=Aspergillus candidus TaxID=41067 RepID=A0A2I2FJX9_ASPCN|nr:6-O-methylguanine DNA methyltransferase [Aspergillus candidus]PLB40947.1 6-O-methylguanine DNA methyltransferase [Aspergillus candidus]